MNDILNPEQDQVLIDLETLSTRTNAAIVAIGATKFTLAGGIKDTFIMNVDPMDCKKLGLHFSKDTIEWWKSQPKETSDLWKEDPQPLATALAAFAKWYGPKSLPTYGNGVRFDNVIMENAYLAVGLALPWMYRDDCCFRTIAKILEVDWKHSKGIPHYALDDAINETEALIRVLKPNENNPPW